MAAWSDSDLRRIGLKLTDFVRGPRVLFKRGTVTDDAPAWVVKDDNYLSARWPGDAYLFAKRFADLLED